MQSQWPDSTYVLIPAYKAFEDLKAFIPKLIRFVPVNKICIVDDGSMDDTGKYCAEKHITYISHSVNQGKGAALVTGFAFLLKKNPSWIITMDADGQHAPEDLQKFLMFAQENPSLGICIGNRNKKPGKMPLPRILSNVITSGILSFLCKCTIKDSQCGYRIYSTALLKRISIEYKRFEMETEVIMKSVKLGFPVFFADVQTLYLSGGSHISHIKDTIRWVIAVLHIYFELRKYSPQST